MAVGGFFIFEPIKGRFVLSSVFVVSYVSKNQNVRCWSIVQWSYSEAVYNSTFLVVKALNTGATWGVLLNIDHPLKSVIVQYPFYPLIKPS
jgi:hypothetical protein